MAEERKETERLVLWRQEDGTVVEVGTYTGTARQVQLKALEDENNEELIKAATAGKVELACPPAGSVKFEEKGLGKKLV